MDSRRVRNQPVHDVNITIFTANNIEQHLANGWTFDQLVGQKVSVLGGKLFTIKCQSNNSIKQLREAIENSTGIEKSKFSLINGQRIVLDSEPVWSNKSLLLMRDGVTKKEPPKQGSTNQSGSLLLRDPHEFRGSHTMTITPECEDNKKTTETTKQESEVQRSHLVDRTPNRSDILAAIRRRDPNQRRFR